MSDTIISIENLGKKYSLRHQGEKQRYVALRDVIAAGTRRVFGRGQPANNGDHEAGPQSNLCRENSLEDFWALKDVSFEVKRGEVVGIIGRNGAGKSTLLKILSRITEPTTGRVHLKGRVASLLEVGTGFHPELTGRENVFLNGAILGMSRSEIRKKFDEIVAFAEVEKFLDTPVKRYSSGMYVRLAFAVAAHLEPEILIVDEVLAVGDAQFQKKCIGKMGEVSNSHGRTILFVSHNMGAVKKLCSRAVVLKSGCLAMDSSVEAGVAHYMSSGVKTPAKVRWSDHNAPHSEEIGFVSVQVTNNLGQSSDVFDLRYPFSIDIEYEIKKPLNGLRIGILLVNAEGIEICGATDTDQSNAFARASGRYRSSCTFPGYTLNSGTYEVMIGADLPPHLSPIVLVPSAVTFAMEELVGERATLSRPPGVIRPQLAWTIQQADSFPPNNFKNGNTQEPIC